MRKIKWSPGGSWAGAAACGEREIKKEKPSISVGETEKVAILKRGGEEGPKGTLIHTLSSGANLTRKKNVINLGFWTPSKGTTRETRRFGEHAKKRIQQQAVRVNEHPSSMEK